MWIGLSDQGQEYQFTAYQATTANQADGQTLHYAFGVPVNRRSAHMQIDPTECRWVFIDEISMVDAELLGRCERNARTLSPKSNLYRYDPESKDERLWAGMNVVFIGDFVQLRPRGSSLATIPSRLRRRTIPSQAELPAQLALELVSELAFVGVGHPRVGVVVGLGLGVVVGHP